MKKKAVKILAFTVGFILIAVFIFFANAFMGNPVSKLLATQTAKKHISTVYAGTDYYIERVRYNFKFSSYYALIKSPSSIDTEFSLSISMLGELKYDGFEAVQRKTTTAHRLESEYRELADTVFNSQDFSYNDHISFGTLEIYEKSLIDNPDVDDVPSYAIVQDDLVLDKIYDIKELGRQAGHLTIYVESNDVSIENAASIMLGIKSIFDEKAIPFKAMDFVLQYPKPTEGKRPEYQINVADFMYDEIYEDGMSERVEKADKALNAYYSEMGAKLKPQ